MTHARLMQFFGFTLAAALLAAPLAAAAAESTGAAGARAGAEFGPRIGMSSTPDQLVLGGQLVFPEFAPHLAISPNVELGFLDHQTVVAINADLLYHFAVQNSVWRPYAGMGLGLAVFQYDSGRFANQSSDTFVGANIVIGAGVPTRSGNRFFAEVRASLGDLPDLKIIAGWNFKM